MTEAVLFDFNGVIVNDEPQHFASMQAVLAEEGIAITREEYYADYLGNDDRTCLIQAFRRANRTLTGGQLERLARAKTDGYQRLIANSLQLVPGASEFVRNASKHFRLALVSGARRHEIEIVLDRAQLAENFEAVIAAEDVPRCKPDPAGYLAAHARLDRSRPLAVAACIVLEDSLPGFDAARAAGMRCVMIATNYSPRRLRDSGATVIWKSLNGHSPAELAGL